MALHFAPAQKPANTATVVHGQSASALRFAQAMAGRAQQRVANDNGVHSNEQAADDRVLRAALRHFAEHGLGAAKEARIQAERAFFNGDRLAYDWWLGITRALDKRVASEAEGLTFESVNP